MPSLGGSRHPGGQHRTHRIRQHDQGNSPRGPLRCLGNIQRQDEKQGTNHGEKQQRCRHAQRKLPQAHILIPKLPHPRHIQECVQRSGQHQSRKTPGRPAGRAHQAQRQQHKRGRHSHHNRTQHINALPHRCERLGNIQIAQHKRYDRNGHVEEKHQPPGQVKNIPAHQEATQ